MARFLRRGAVVSAFVSLLLGAAIAPSLAAEPVAVLDQDGEVHTWTGGPFTAFQPSFDFTGFGVVDCAGGAQDPTCDHHWIRVVDPDRHYTLTVTVGIPDGRSDDFDIYLYDESGTRIATSSGSGSPPPVEQIQVDDLPTGNYEIRVQPWVVDEGATYSGEAEFNFSSVSPRRYGLDTKDCSELVPVKPQMLVVDDQRIINLDVTVLLDGVSEPAARALFAKAAVAYEPLKINLNVVEYIPFTVPNDDATMPGGSAEGEHVNSLARAFLDGSRPNRSDVVYTLTSKDLWNGEADAKAYGLLGVADCIGGVRHGERAFATGELDENLDLDFGGGIVLKAGNVGPKVAAHEIGHVVGAHHHYFNCAEGIPTEAADGEVTPCTLMAPYVDLQSINFGQAEAAVVRAHVLAFASANDSPEPVVPEAPGPAAVLPAIGVVLVVLVLGRRHRFATGQQPR